MHFNIATFPIRVFSKRMSNDILTRKSKYGQPQSQLQQLYTVQTIVKKKSICEQKYSEVVKDAESSV